MAGLGGLAGFIAGNPTQAYDDARLRSQKVQQGDIDSQAQALAGSAYQSMVPGAQPLTPTQQQGQGLLQTILQRLQGGGPTAQPQGSPQPQGVMPSPGPGMGQGPGGPMPGGSPPSAVPGARPMQPPPQMQAGPQGAPGTFNGRWNAMAGSQPNSAPPQRSASADPNNPQNWTGAQWDTPQGPQGMTFAQRGAPPSAGVPGARPMQPPMGGPSPQPPSPGMGQPPPGGPSMPGQPPAGGQQPLNANGPLDLRTVMRSVVQSAQRQGVKDPRVIAGAISRFLPLMQADQREQATMLRDYLMMRNFQQGGKNDPSNVQEIAEGIKSGRQPPTLTGLYGNSAPVRAALEKDGFNLAKADLEWKIAQRQVASLNGPQMTRFVGLGTSVVNTIDEVNSLAKQMQLSGIPLLNRAQLALYAQTQGNSPNGQLAAKYIGAVNTLKEEFANLANGGYAPTDAAWKLANEQINADYGVDQLGASLNEVQRLINYRLQAVPNIGAMGPGSENRYTPKGAGAPPQENSTTSSGSAPATAGVSKPKQVIQNGHTYDLQPDGSYK